MSGEPFCNIMEPFCNIGAGPIHEDISRSMAPLDDPNTFLHSSLLPASVCTTGSLLLCKFWSSALPTWKKWE